MSYQEQHFFNTTLPQMIKIINDQSIAIKNLNTTVNMQTDIIISLNNQIRLMELVLIMIGVFSLTIGILFLFTKLFKVERKKRYISILLLGLIILSTTTNLVHADNILIGNDVVINANGNLGFSNDTIATSILVMSNNTISLENIQIGNITYPDYALTLSDNLNATINSLATNNTILKCDTQKDNSTVKIYFINKPILSVMGANSWNQTTNIINPFTGVSFITISFNQIQVEVISGFLLVFVIALIGILLFFSRRN